MLLDKYFFDEIEINFMVVGHTKFACDRNFGTYKKALKKEKAMDLEDAVKVCQQLYN